MAVTTKSSGKKAVFFRNNSPKNKTAATPETV
jgi:hypothetical protein